MYIDPNTGGVVFAALVGMFGVISGLLLGFSSKIRQGFAKMRRSARKDKGEEQE